MRKVDTNKSSPLSYKINHKNPDPHQIYSKAHYLLSVCQVVDRLPLGVTRTKNIFRWISQSFQFLHSSSDVIWWCRGQLGRFLAPVTREGLTTFAIRWPDPKIVCNMGRYVLVCVLINSIKTTYRSGFEKCRLGKSIHATTRANNDFSFTSITILVYNLFVKLLDEGRHLRKHLSPKKPWECHPLLMLREMRCIWGPANFSHNAHPLALGYDKEENKRKWRLTRGGCTLFSAQLEHNQGSTSGHLSSPRQERWKPLRHLSQQSSSPKSLHTSHMNANPSSSLFPFFRPSSLGISFTGIFALLGLPILPNTVLHIRFSKRQHMRCPHPYGHCENMYIKKPESGGFNWNKAKCLCAPTALGRSSSSHIGLITQDFFSKQPFSLLHADRV